MFSSSNILDNIKKDETVEYKKLCRLLKISKKNDKEKLNIALDALEKLEIIKKNDKNEFKSIDDENHIVAKIFFEQFYLQKFFLFEHPSRNHR